MRPHTTRTHMHTRQRPLRHSWGGAAVAHATLDPLPAPLAALARRLTLPGDDSACVAVFDPNVAPNHVLVNDYGNGAGIDPHTGMCRYPRAHTRSLNGFRWPVVLSAGGRVVARFSGAVCARSQQHTSGAYDGPEVQCWSAAVTMCAGGRCTQDELGRVLLAPRSLLVFAHDAYTHHLHRCRAHAHASSADGAVRMPPPPPPPPLQYSFRVWT